MTVVAAVHPWPPAPRIAAWQVRAGLAAVAAAADAVICSFLANMWLLFLGMAAVEIGRLEWGDDSPVVAAMREAVTVSGATLLLIFFFGLVPLMVASKERAATDIEAAKGSDRESWQWKWWKPCKTLSSFRRRSTCSCSLVNCSSALRPSSRGLIGREWVQQSFTSGPWA